MLPFIDGYRHVARIAHEADVEVSLVKACIQNMIYYGLVRLIPIFQYSNVYVTTPRLVELYSDAALIEECLRAVAKQDGALPSFKHVLQLYAAMRPGNSICGLFSHTMYSVMSCKL